MTIQRKRMILTGARGSIGKAITAYMAREHPEVEIVPLLPFPFRNSAILELLKTPTDYFVNTASLGSDSESLLKPHDYFGTNVNGVLNQIEMIRLYSPKTRYLAFGTTFENGDSLTPYAASKRMQRELISSYRESFGLFAMTARLGFTESIHRSEHYLARKITKAVARIAAALKNDESFGPLVLRDVDIGFFWTAAEDVAQGIWLMLNQETPNDYSLVTREERTLREFVTCAFEVAGISAVWFSSKEGFRLITMKDFPGAQVTDKTVVIANGTRIAGGWSSGEAAYKELGWKPRFTLEYIIREMTLHDLKEVGL